MAYNGHPKHIDRVRNIKGAVYFMELTHDSLLINDLVNEASLEQSIELDYLLPDYLKNIFKVVMCKVTPKITSYRILGDKLNIDAVAVINILYISEDGGMLSAIEQKQSFSKIFDIKESDDNLIIEPYIESDFTNCRVVNPRRIDLRAAVTVSVKVYKPKKTEYLSDAQGSGIQLLKKEMPVTADKKVVSKQFNVSESIDTTYGKNPIKTVLINKASAYPTECKTVANKIIVKGEIHLHILYLTEDSSEPEVIEHVIPISQIVDMPGIDDTYTCVNSFDICSCEITKGEDENSIDADFAVNVTSTAFKRSNAVIIKDAFSTRYPVENKFCNFNSEMLLSPVSEQFVVKNSIETDLNKLEKIIDAVADIKNHTIFTEDGIAKISGTIDVKIIVIGSDNIPESIDKNFPFELIVYPDAEDKNVSGCVNFCVASLSFTMSGENKIDISAEIKANGYLTELKSDGIICDIALNDNSGEKERSDSALTLYFADSNENLWNIAKRFNTSMKAIAEENNLESDEITMRGMILIPMTD